MSYTENYASSPLQYKQKNGRKTSKPNKRYIHTNKYKLKHKGNIRNKYMLQVINQNCIALNPNN